MGTFNNPNNKPLILKVALVQTETYFKSVIKFLVVSVLWHATTAK